ncbi:WXG100 family type VII secretion target [Flindersiella endophytica]
MANVSPDKIRDSAKELEKTADRLDDEFDAFLGDVYGVGEAAGEAEMVGQVIGSGLDEAEVVLIEALESVVDGLHWYAETLKIMADNYDQIEDANARIVNDVWPGE